jgi:hypothetical protein
MTLKLNVLLAKTDALAASFRASVTDFRNFFSAKQAEFRGERKTYEPASGTIDLPSERGEKKVVTTVDEKLKWFEETHKDYVDALFSQEATNASGTAKAELKVGGTSWGTFSSLELLRLKSLVENGELDQMYNAIPVRSDSEIWEACTNESYAERTIVQSPLLQGMKKSTLKEQYILPDPNVTRETAAKYTPQIASKDTHIDLGNYTHQKYSGEWTHRQRAELLRRKQILYVAIIEALKVANEVETVESSLTSTRIFNYLHKGVN